MRWRSPNKFTTCNYVSHFDSVHVLSVAAKHKHVEHTPNTAHSYTKAVHALVHTHTHLYSHKHPRACKHTSCTHRKVFCVRGKSITKCVMGGGGVILSKNRQHYTCITGGGGKK